MENGINESLQGANDALKSALDYLTSIETKIKSIRKETEEVGKSATKFAKGTQKASDAGGAAGVGGSRSMKDWYQGIKDGFAKITGGVSQDSSASKSSTDSGKTAMGMPVAQVNTGGGGGKSGSPAAAAPTSSGSTGANPVSNFSLPTAVGAVGVAAAAGLWDATPSPTDAMTRQLGLFPMAYTMSGQSPITMQTTQDLDKYLRGLYGKNMSGPFDYLAAANATRYSGYGLNTAEFAMNQKAAGNMYALTGMNNVMGAQAGADLRSGTYSSRLSDIGIFTNDLQTGAPKDVGTIVDELWDRFYPGNQNITLEDIEVDLASGYLGNNLQQLFGDNPGLYMQIVEGFRLKAKAKGRRGIKWSADAKDKNSAAAVMEQYGVMDTEVNKNILLGEGVAAKTENLASASPGLLGGFDAAQEYIIGFNKALADATEALGPFANAMYGVKGFFQIFSGSPEGAMPLKILGSLLGLIPGMAGGGDASGHVNTYRGSSTSDSVPAMLSRGEYVINARSASILGKDTLDRLNATGQTFGSAFTQPVKFLAGGGDSGPGVGQVTLNGWGIGLAWDDPRLADFPVPGTDYTIRLRKDYGPNLIDVAAAWQASPVLGGTEKWNLKQGAGTYGYGGTRMNPSGTGWSNHGAGLAMDLLPELLPDYQNGDYFSKEELDAIHGIPGIASGNVDWGGDWGPGEKDQMHFEIFDQSVVPGAQLGTATGTNLGEGSQGVTPARRGVESPGVVGWAGSSGPEGMLTPMLSAAGVNARWARASSLAPYSAASRGAYGKLTAQFTNSLLPTTSNSGSAITLYGTTSSVATQPDSATSGDASASDQSSSSVNFNNAATGSGPEWLYQFLVDHGLRGQQLHTWWTIGMRESGGDPSNTTHGGSEDWTSSGEPHYDVGLFQINNTHLDNIKSVYGASATMQMMLDANKNFEYTMHLSSNGTNLTPWALEPDGQTFNFSQYSADWISKYGNETEQNHAILWSEFDKYNKYSYSQGAYRTHEGPAKLHEGELIMPALAAEEFRKMMREAVSGGNSGTGDVMINLSIAQASEAEAIRFAHRVKALLKDDDRILTMRNR